MRIVLVCCLAIMNVGALLLLAPHTGNSVYEAIGLDPGYREFGGWLLFAGMQTLLLIVSNQIVTSSHSSDRQYWLVRHWYDEAQKKLAALVEQAQLCGEGQTQLAVRVARLRRKLRKKQQRCTYILRKFHQQNVEIAELRKLQLHLDDADYDDERYVVLLREVAQLRERLQVAVSREEHEHLLAEYHELRGRLASQSQGHEKNQEADAQHSLE